MPNRANLAILLVLSALLVPVSTSVVFAADPQLEPGSSPPPDSVASAVKDQLQAAGVRVQVDGKLLGEFWMRKDLPTAGGGNAPLGVNFPMLAESTLAGVAQFPAAWVDYKGQAIPAGVYTLRYGVEPADGNHMGVSSYRDFLLLVPAADDRDLSVKFNYQQLVDLSRKASGTNHPAVLALFPVTDEVSEPKLIKNELDQWTLAVPFGANRLGIVLIGKGEGAM